MTIKGADAYFAYIINSSESRKDVSQVLIIREFPYVFPGELLRVPPEREVEFLIELEHRTTSISYTPYKMTPLELKEMKAQFQDLLVKDFIRPSLSL